MADVPEEIPLPVAEFEADGFLPMTLADLGADATRRMVGRPLSTISLFRDARTSLPAIFLRFDGVLGVLADEGLLLSPRPVTRHPWATLDMTLVSGAGLGQVKYLRPDDPALASSPEPGAMAAPGDVSVRCGPALTLASVIALLISPEVPDPARRQEMADLLKPVLATFEADIRSEMAKRQAEQLTTTEGRP